MSEGSFHSRKSGHQFLGTRLLLSYVKDVGKKVVVELILGLHNCGVTVIYLVTFVITDT